MMYREEDEIFVYDQKCAECRWFGEDLFTGEAKCRNRKSEKQDSTNSEDWCWRWEKRRGGR